MPTIGNIVEDGKLLVPVYVEGEGSSSSGEGSTTIIPTSTLGLTGGFYSGTFYGMALGSDGRLTTFSWNRSGDPVVISNGLSLPISGNPTATGYMIYNEISSSTNIIHITQSSETITSGNFDIDLNYTFYYSTSNSATKTFKIQFSNETQKNLNINLNIEGPFVCSDSSWGIYESNITFNLIVNSNTKSSEIYFHDWNDSISTSSLVTKEQHSLFTFQVLN